MGKVITNNGGSVDIRDIPTKGQRVYGTLLALIIFLLMSVFLYFTSIELYKKHDNLTSFIISLILFSGSLFLLLRVAFTKASKPSDRAVTVAGYTAVIVGVLVLLVGKIYGPGDDYIRFLEGIGSGIVSIFSGLSIIITKRKNRRR